MANRGDHGVAVNPSAQESITVEQISFEDTNVASEIKNNSENDQEVIRVSASNKPRMINEETSKSNQHISDTIRTQEELMQIDYMSLT